MFVGKKMGMKKERGDKTREENQNDVEENQQDERGKSKMFVDHDTRGTEYKYIYYLYIYIYIFYI